LTPPQSGKAPARAILLGTAAGGGYPQWNCRCPVCTLAWSADPRVTPRTQSSLAVTGDGETWSLFNASPDLGRQIRATPALWPKQPLRQSPIGAVVLTNADVDHVAGLLSLRERHPFRLIALEPVHAALDANSVFDALDRTVVRRVVVRPGQAFEATPGVSVALVPVPGKAPLYAEGENPAVGVENGETAGAFLTVGATRLAYVPGCAALTPSSVEKLAQVDVVLFDGTLFVDDEMIRMGIGQKTGRRMGHLPITGPGGSLEALQALPAKRRIYVHINNTNPTLIDGSPERVIVERAGLEIAADGMEIGL
jgi:pyrroloquinoline quinone biosynthesis protein B